VASLLYEGPWVAERQLVVQALLRDQPEALDATVHRVITAATRFDAADAFRARYRLEELRARVAPLWEQVDALMVPTAPTCPTRAAVAAEPVLRNSELGRYTNFVNLLGLAALALPSEVPEEGLPFGVTFIAHGGADAALLNWARHWEAGGPALLGARLRPSLASDRLSLPGAPEPEAAPALQIAVVGAHLQGMPLHSQLLERGCRFIARTCTAKAYQLFALPGTHPPKPGLARVGKGQAGHAIEVEVYEMPQAHIGSFLALIPPPLGLGSVELADGHWVKGFICEPHALAGATVISAFGGWRAYRATQ
jgi:allophanate hydrolase